MQLKLQERKNERSKEKEEKKEKERGKERKKETMGKGRTNQQTKPTSYAAAVAAVAFIMTVRATSQCCRWNEIIYDLLKRPRIYRLIQIRSDQICFGIICCLCL